MGGGPLIGGPFIGGGPMPTAPGGGPGSPSGGTPGTGPAGAGAPDCRAVIAAWNAAATCAPAWPVSVMALLSMSWPLYLTALLQAPRQGRRAKFSYKPLQERRCGLRAAWQVGVQAYRCTGHAGSVQLCGLCC